MRFTAGTKTVYRSGDSSMTWWAAKNWCEALGKNMSPQKNLSLLDISGTRLGCYKDGATAMWNITAGSGYGYCCGTSGQSCSSTASLQSQEMQDLRSLGSGLGWTATDFYAEENSCIAYVVYLSNGYVGHHFSRSSSFYALCE